MRIVITNAVLNNTGDAAIAQGICESLIGEGLCSQDEITILDSNAAVSRGLYPSWKIVQQLSSPPPRRSKNVQRLEKILRYVLAKFLSIAPWILRLLPRLDRVSSSIGSSLECIMKADVVISSGGTYLVDHYDFRHRVAELELAARLGKPVFLWTQSMGPFNSKRAKRTIRGLRGVASGVYFRDERSRQAWERVLPLPESSAVVPDVVFSLIQDQGTNNADRKGTSKHPRVAVSVRKWSTTMEGQPFDFSIYREALRTSVGRMVDDGFSIEALSTCQGTPGYSVDDAITAREIFEGLDLSIRPSHHTPDQLLEELAGCDLVIATRMHFAILALIAHKPVIAIAYEFKTKELFKSLGLGDNVIEIENVTAPWILSRVEKLGAERFALSLPAASRAEICEGARSPARQLKLFMQANESSLA